MRATDKHAHQRDQRKTLLPIMHGKQNDLSTGEDGTAVHGKTDQDMP
jgi:hypothetical protein